MNGSTKNSRYVVLLVERNLSSLLLFIELCVSGMYFTLVFENHLDNILYTGGD
jgi:hypothetical protein